MLDKKDSSLNVPPIEVIWGENVGKSPFETSPKTYSLTPPLFLKSKPLESYSPPMAPSSYPATNIPLPPTPQAPQKLNLPVQKSSFFFLAFGLMILGICFFLAGFLFSLWVNKQSTILRAHSLPAASPASNKDLPSKFPSQPSPKLQEIKAAIKSAANTPGLLQANQAINSPTDKPLKKEAPSTPSGGRYGIQLGAFVTQENAIDLVNKLKSRKISALIKTEEDDTGAKLFCVRTTDEFSNYQSAESAASSLFHQETISAFVVPLVNLKQKT